MKEYIEAQTRENTLILGNSVSDDEIKRFSRSDKRWAESRAKEISKVKPVKGEVYQFEFGKNYRLEMAYEHRGLIIGTNKKLLYVLPIYSYNPAKYRKVYHPEDSPDPNCNLFLLKSSDFRFISHDSVLKLNDLRTVSVSRILYQHDGRVDPDSETFKLIEHLAFRKCFATIYFDYDAKCRENEGLKTRLDESESSMAKIKDELDGLKAENEDLKKDIVQMNENK